VSVLTAAVTDTNKKHKMYLK